MKEKDNSKCKEWERRRRGKLNDAFKSLCQLLPNYDPAKNLAKIDILERSTEFVKALRLSNSRLLSQQAETDEKCKLIQDLQDEVNKLILRVKQLTILLKQASISIPLGPSIKSLGKKKLKWSSNKAIIPDNLENKAVSIRSELPIPQSIFRDTSTDKPVSGEIIVQNAPALINPLKESNGDLQSDKDSTPKIVTNTTSPDLSNTPVIEPPPKSNPMQLPMQTIILTSCPITPVVNQAPQMITRIALGPTRLLPKPLSGISPLHKIAIRPILKPLPPKEKKRRNRKKKVLIEKVDAETQSKTDESIAPLPNRNSETEETETVLNDGKIAEITPINTDEVVKLDVVKSLNDAFSGSISSETKQNNLTDRNLESDSNEEVVTPTIEEPCKENVTQNVEIETEDLTASAEPPREIESVMEVDISIGEEVEVSTHVEQSIENITLTATVVETASTVDSKDPEIEQSENSMDQVELEPIREVDNVQTEVPSKQSDTSYMDISFPHPKAASSCNETQNPNIVHKVAEKIQNPDVGLDTCKINKSSKGEELSEPMVIDVQPIPASNPTEVTNVTNPSISDTVNGDKISECIARSIDLIDGPEGELMELAGNWGDHVHSPKSPISPTQMFLNMFPLLPRETIVAVSESSQQSHNKNQYTPHRPYFIDSMHPDEHSVGNTNIGGNSSQDPVIIPLTPARSNSLVLSTSSVQDSNAFRLTEMSPVHTAPPKTISSESALLVPNRTGLGCVSQISNSKQEIRPVSSSLALTHKSVELAPSQSQQNPIPRDVNMFEFSHFHPGSDYVENVFKDVSRSRTGTECRHAPGYSSTAVRSISSTSHLTPVQPIISSAFQNETRITQAPSAAIGSVQHHFPTQELRQQSDQSISNVLTHHPFSSHSFIPHHNPPLPNHHPPAPRRVNNPNPNPTTQEESHGASFSYSIDNSLRHPYTDRTPSQKQSSDTTLKPQLFRPPVRDFQQQPAQHNFQQACFSSKAPSSVVNTKPVSTKSDTPTTPTKRQKLAQTMPHTQGLQSNQSHVPQMLHKPNCIPIPNLPHGSIPNPIAPQSQPQLQYHSIGIHMEKPSAVSSHQPRNYQQQKASTIESSNKGYPKPPNKDSNPNLARSSPTCQSRRQPAVTSIASTLIPMPEMSSPLILNSRNQHQPAITKIQRLSDPSSRPQPQTVATFPDFSLSNFNQPHQTYEPYNLNYPQSSNSQPPAVNPVSLQRKSTRPTPFYLQDVQTHCEPFSFDPSSNSSLVSVSQEVMNSSYDTPKPQYPNTAHPVLSSISSNQNPGPQYFMGSSQSQASCQESYAHHQSSSTPISTRNQQHNTNIPDNPILYNPNPNNTANQHQEISQAKSKPGSSSQSQVNQTAYSTGSGNLPNPNSSSTPTSSRPVNWMTDTPYRTNKSSPSTVNNNTTANNPFSVSKLVGNASTPSNSNTITNPNSITISGINNSNSRSNSSCINRNTSYCAEALIRKNPAAWNNINFGPPPVPQQHQILQPSSTACTPYQSGNNDHLNNFSSYPSNLPHHSNSNYPNPNSSINNTVSGNPNAFNHFDHHVPISPSNQQQSHQHHHQYHFSQPHGSHHQQQPHHHHGTTSSVSNFNLSSIFPEINDKRNNSTNNTNNNLPPGNTNNSTNSSASGPNNNCGYYSSLPIHGNLRK